MRRGDGVVPGDESTLIVFSHLFFQNARYLVWKYRYKKQKLWKNLEKKYGEPVLEEFEWPDEEDNMDETNVGDDHDDLDDGATDSGDAKDEPDL